MSDLQAAVTAALRDAFTSQGDPETGSLLGEWVLTSETYGANGQVYLHTLRSKDIAAWKALGMLEAHAGDLRAAMLQPGDD